MTSGQIVEALARASSVDEIHELCLRIITHIDSGLAERIPIPLPTKETRGGKLDSENNFLVSNCSCNETALFSPFSAGSQEKGRNQNLVAFPLAYFRLNYLSGRLDHSLVSTPNNQNKAELTDREKECLYWAAEGKTSWETAKILQISKRTVVFHLQNASRKLNAANRQNAIARAVVLGLITPQVN